MKTQYYLVRSSLPKSYFIWNLFLIQSNLDSLQDCFVKFHDISTHTAKPDRSLKTAVPVWKARYTPFGDGLATVIVPQVKHFRMGMSKYEYGSEQEPWNVNKWKYCQYSQQDILCLYMLRINWSRFGLEDCRIKLHPENLPLGKSSFSLVTPKKWNSHRELTGT